jgi:hypothetical protein
MLPPSISEMIWHCHCCKSRKPDGNIKAYRHDISNIYQLESGMLILNIRYCNDNPSCFQKAKNREWIISNFNLDHN